MHACFQSPAPSGPCEAFRQIQMCSMVHMVAGKTFCLRLFASIMWAACTYYDAHTADTLKFYDWNWYCATCFQSGAYIACCKHCCHVQMCSTVYLGTCKSFCLRLLTSIESTISLFPNALTDNIQEQCMLKFHMLEIICTYLIKGQTYTMFAC